MCVWCGAIFVLITVRHRTYWSRRKNKADIQQKHNKQTQIGIGPRVAVSRVYGTGTHPTTMMQQRENTDSEYHTDGGARDSHVVAELHDLEGQNQSASLIHSDHAPDYNYPPDKCCCCCCNVESDDQESFKTLASCPPFLYKRRVGNYYVCCSSVDKKRDGLEKIHCIVPMCWPMLCVTYFLISIVSVPMLYYTLARVHPLWAAVEISTTATLYLALALTSFRDFGVFPRYTKRPRADQVPPTVSTVSPVRIAVVSRAWPCRSVLSSNPRW